MTLTRTERYVLLLISRNKRAFGWELHEKVNRATWWPCRWSSPAFYAFMARMEDRGLVKRYKVSFTFFELTEAGRAAIAEPGERSGE